VNSEELCGLAAERDADHDDAIRVDLRLGA
jgi:hypothetical protein